MKQINFTMDKIFTFGNKDAEHRFIIRNHFLQNNPEFKGLKVGDAVFEVIIDIKHTKNTIDIDNVPKVIIDAFSLSQIKRDLCDLEKYNKIKLEKDCKNTKRLSDAKQKEYAIISKMELFKPCDYESIGLYPDDTIEHIQKLTCTASTDNPTQSIQVTMKAI